MRSSFSDRVKNLKIFVILFFAATLSLNVVKNTTPIFAADNTSDNTYIFRIVSSSGRTLHTCSNTYNYNGTPSVDTAVTEVGSQRRVEIYQAGSEYPFCTSSLLNLSDLVDANGNYAYKLQMYNRSNVLIAESTPFYFSGSGTHSAAMQILCDESRENCTATATSETGQTTTTVSTETLESASVCSKAAKGFSWILCTASDLLTGALDGIYGGAKKLLTINSSMLAADDSSGAYVAWGHFRNFANILFVIFLLFVIFSQITGIGIDNYGIKKSLPRLVAAALLVNLSYYLCIIAVDLSNIVGSSIGQVFDNIQISSNASGSWSAANVAAASAGGIGVLGLGFGGLLAAGGGVAAIAAGGIGATLAAGAIAALIGFLGALISVVTALLMLVVLLGARWGIVLIGVAVAPIAFVCYILPNTKTVFDKWVKIMEAMLFLYPMCTLATSGGKFASKVILSTNNGQSGFLLVLIASIIQVVPYFFIPNMVRGAFKIAGNVGATAARWGNNLGRAGQGALANTRLAQRNATNLEATRRQAVDMNRIRDAQRRAGLPEMTRRQAREYFENQRAAEANQQIAEHQRKITNAAYWSDPSTIAAATAALESKDRSDRIKSRESLIMNNSFTYNDGTADHSVDPNSARDLQNALENALGENYHGADRTADINAIINVLSAQGDAGRTAVHAAMANATAAAGASGISDEARRAYASNIMQFHANDYKNNMRSVFDYAKVNTGERAEVIVNATTGTSRAATFADYATQSVGSLKQEQLAAMDEAELKRYASALADADPTHFNFVRRETFATEADATAENNARRAALQKLAYDTLHNASLAQQIKGSQRTILEGMATGYVPPRVAPTEVRIVH